MIRFCLLLAIGVGIVVVDASSKVYTLEHISPGGISLWEGLGGLSFSLTRVANSGTAWGLFSKWPTLLLIARLLLVAALLAYLCRRHLSFFRRLALVFILAGAVGNLIDIFRYGAVIDMIHIVFWGYSYPVFNIADSAIFCGICAFALQALRK